MLTPGIQIVRQRFSDDRAVEREEDTLRFSRCAFQVEVQLTAFEKGMFASVSGHGSFSLIFFVVSGRFLSAVQENLGGYNCHIGGCQKATVGYDNVLA